MDIIVVLRRADPDDPDSLREVDGIRLEPGDVLRVGTTSQRRVATLLPPITALANAISGSATVEVIPQDELAELRGTPRVIATVAPKSSPSTPPRVIAVVKPKS